ncbi:MAG: sigma-70 family RNA polymerase sigma factor [Gemmatales bacterium]
MNRVLQYLQRGTNQSLSGDAPTDQELLERFLQTHDQDAFADLVRRHELSVLKACRQVLRSAVDVDDAFQATFLVLIRRARQVRWQPSLRSWLVAVAHRIAVRLAMTQKRIASALNSHDFSYDAASPLTEVSWQEACAVLHEELNQMRDQFRLPLLLCYLQGYSRDEAAAQLGWSLGSVKAGLERGRQQLKARLERRGVTLSAGLFTMLASSQSTEAGALSPVAAALALLTGNVPTKVAALSRGTSLAGNLLASRLALVALILLIGTAAGVTLTWAKCAQDSTLSPKITSIVAPNTASAVDQPDAITVTGVVLNPAGEPVSGATLTVVKPPARISRSSVKPQPAESGTTTDAQGRFQLTVNQPLFHLVAQKQGYGLDFVLVSAEKAKQPVKLQLGIEMPIQGTILDEHQKPVEGAKLGITNIRRFQPSVLEDALEQVLLKGDSYIPYSIEVDYLSIGFGSLVTATSDAQGRFILHGLPVGSLSQFQYAEAGLVSKATTIALLPGFDAKGTTRHGLTALKLEEALLKRHAQPETETIEQTRQRYNQRANSREFEGASLKLGMQKGVSIEGTVRNLKGEPVAGMTVFTGSHLGSATTDQQGHYRLDSVAPAPDYTVQAQSHGKYLVAQSSAFHRESGPIRIDLQVRPGAILRGKVIDGKTGKGVRSFVQVKPTPGNPLLNKPNVLLESSTSTEADGTFHLIAPPGDVIVTASPDAGLKRTEPMPYLLARMLPSHQGLLQQHGEGNDVSFQGSTKVYQLNYAYQLLELPTEGETTVELTIARGPERTLHLIDPQGKPIESAIIAGLDQNMQAFTVKGGTHQIVGLSATERTRHLFIMDGERKLGAFFTVPKNGTEPLTVQLEPLASFSSRLVDSQNQPRALYAIGIRPELNTDRSQASVMLRQIQELSQLKDFFPTINTDQDGRFTLNNIIPNMNFRIYSIHPNGVAIPADSLSKTIQLKPGEKRKEGELKTPVNRPRPGTGR